jgi:hypothetical protein
MIYKNQPGFIYLASHPDGLLKIGFTVNLRQRLRALSNGIDSPPYVARKSIVLISVFEGLDYHAEQELHQRFAAHRIGTRRSEWYMDCVEIRQHFTASPTAVDEALSRKKQREYRRERRQKGLGK